MTKTQLKRVKKERAERRRANHAKGYLRSLRAETLRLAAENRAAEEDARKDSDAVLSEPTLDMRFREAMKIN